MRKFRYAIILLLAVAVWFGYQHRLRLEAWFWHLKNHGTLTFGAYLVPVPSNWAVHSFADGDKLLFRVDRDPRTPEGAQFPVTISVLDDPLKIDLSKWVELEVAAAQRDSGNVLRRDFTLGDEKMICLGGQLTAKPPGNRAPLAWHCRSSGRLELLIVGTEPDMPQIWDMLSHIKHATTP